MQVPGATSFHLAREADLRIPLNNEVTEPRLKNQHLGKITAESWTERWKNVLKQIEKHQKRGVKDSM